MSDKTQWLLLAAIVPWLIVYVYYRSNIKLIAQLDAEIARGKQLAKAAAENSLSASAVRDEYEELIEKDRKRFSALSADLNVYIEAFQARKAPARYLPQLRRILVFGRTEPSPSEVLRSDQAWINKATKFVTDVEQLSSESRRRLEEAVRFNCEGTVETPLVMTGRALLESQPQTVQGNLFEMTSQELTQISNWINFVIATGPDDYSQLDRHTRRLLEKGSTEDETEPEEEAY